MANPVWPLGLPQQAVRDGFREDAGNGLLRTQMEAGPAKQRRRFSARPRNVTCTVVMTSAQLELFEEFYDDTLDGGALSFDWVHPRKGTPATLRFTDKSPSWNTRGGDNWDVVLELEVMP